MVYEYIVYEVSDKIVIIMLNWFDCMNVWMLIMEWDVCYVMEVFSVNDDVCVIILIGVGCGFCVGVDMDVLKGFDFDDVRCVINLLLFDMNCWLDWQMCYGYYLLIKKFVIVMFNGVIVGIGFVYVFYCDLCFVVDNMVFIIVFVWCGLIVEYGMFWMLLCIVGYVNVMDFLFLVCCVFSEEVLWIGFVNWLCLFDKLCEEIYVYVCDLVDLVLLSVMVVIKC